MKLFSNYISNKILLGQSKITIATYLPKVVILALCPLLDNLLSFSLFHQIRNKHMKTVNPISHSVPVSVQSLSRVRLFVTPWTTAHQASLSITNSQSPPKPMSIESVMPSNHLILCRPLLLLPSIFPSIGVFSNESALRIRWPKYWRFSFNISLSNVHPGLISFRMDWLDLLAVKGTVKSILQYHSSKASILQCSAFTSIDDHWKKHRLD